MSEAMSPEAAASSGAATLFAGQLTFMVGTGLLLCRAELAPEPLCDTGVRGDQRVFVSRIRPFVANSRRRPPEVSFPPRRRGPDPGWSPTTKRTASWSWGLSMCQSHYNGLERGGAQPIPTQVVSAAWIILIALLQPGLLCRRVS